MTSYSEVTHPWKYESLESCLTSLRDTAQDRKSDELHCRATWDTISCWPSTMAGTVVRQPCPPLTRGVDHSKFSFRECRIDGTWAGVSPSHPEGYTNYYDCYTNESRDIYQMLFNNSSPSLMKTIARGTRIVEIVGLSVSFVALIVSVLIFCCFRKLRCDRTRMHRNLFCAILVHDAILLVAHVDLMVAMTLGRLVAGTLISAPGTIFATPMVCEMFCAFVEYTKTVTFMWMLIEGVYLHNTIVVSVYSSNPNYIIFYVIGWGLALIPTAIWATVNIHENRNGCWYLYQLHRCYWIVEGPRIIVICVNGCFLLSIVRELVNKLNANNTSEALQAWKAARATIILIPLFGISNVLSMTKPSFDQPVKFALWSYSAVFFSSFQGFFISLFYCFINGEVRSILTLHWRRRQSAQFVCRDKEQPRPTTGTLSSPVNIVLENMDALSTA